ncbi:hypothetical protein MJ570_10980 [Escherichia coli]|nr:hypothetical protein MJ570_10980 [Escherichia coli]
MPPSALSGWNAEAGNVWKKAAAFTRCAPLLYGDPELEKQATFFINLQKRVWRPATAKA